MSQIASFRAKLSLLTDYLDDPGITEVAINRPGEVWIGRQGQRYMQHADVPELNYRLLESLAEVTAAYTNQETDRERPLLAATMPINLAEGVDDTERGGYRAFYAQVAAALRGEGPMPVDPAESLEAIRIIEELHGRQHRRQHGRAA